MRSDEDTGLRIPSPAYFAQNIDSTLVTGGPKMQNIDSIMFVWKISGINMLQVLRGGKRSQMKRPPCGSLLLNPLLLFYRVGRN
jgi:hypothetical protein